LFLMYAMLFVYCLLFLMYAMPDSKREAITS